MNKKTFTNIRKKHAFPLFCAVALSCAMFCGCSRETSSNADAESSSQPPLSESQPEPSANIGPSAGPGGPTEETPETAQPNIVEPFPSQGQEEEEETGSLYLPPDYEWENSAIIATDIHYLARSLTDGGSRFQYMVEHGDGKIVTYIDQITDAFLEEVFIQKPDILILSGDLTLDGEKKSHEELAEKLYRVKNAGIPVLVIPGNHDINNRRAAQYKGEERSPAEFTTPEEFRYIYRDFGYDEAVSEDPLSLSYVYQVDEYNRMLMLDTCQYQQKALVGGAILSDTYDWIEGQLEDAWSNGINIIPVAHHNLLDQSEIYVDDCTIEHGEQLASMLEDWGVPLFLSGHLHVQHTKRSEEHQGIWEMVTSSLATPACQYGRLIFRDDGSFAYWTQAVDVERWARKHNRTEKDLLEFDEFKEPFLRRVFYHQSYDALQSIESFSETQRVQMSQLYSELNYHYYQGTAYQVRNKILKDPDYLLWLEDGSFTVLSDYVQYIVSDAKRNYNWVEMD